MDAIRRAGERHRLGAASAQPLLLAPSEFDAGGLGDVTTGFLPVRRYEEFGTQLAEILRTLAIPMGVCSQHADLVEEKTTDFVGRDRVFDAINSFIEANSCGYFQLLGDPGDGKTTIMAEYVRRTGCVAHFNVRSQGVNTPRQFVDNLGVQLTARYGIAGPVDTGDSSRYGETIGRMLKEARAALPDDVPLVIAVDALDEAERPTDDTAGNVLFLPPRLPKGVYFVVSSRRAEVSLRIETASRPYDLAHHLDSTMVDIGEYLTRMSSRPALRSWLAERNIPLPRFVGVLAEKSEGNFMYLRHVLPELSNGLYQSLDIQQLPHGLKNYYESHWRLMGMATKSSPRTKVWIVYVLCELTRPVSIALLARVMREVQAGVDAIAIQEVLTEWQQFLRRDADPDGPRFSIYHTSFRDFLHKRDTIASAGLTLTGVNGVISDVLWEEEYGEED
ncbi:hypothetical protein ACGFYQ_34760 [Streptomyces sp. NPDC048258]|uniref:hypothetical protein n=1 Tax=Streptomyces sp. NPDC048258 TaxID=3365527 RepID=UPI0037155E28